MACKQGAGIKAGFVGSKDPVVLYSTVIWAVLGLSIGLGPGLGLNCLTGRLLLIETSLRTLGDTEALKRVSRELGVRGF